MTPGELIRDVRRRQGLNQRQLALRAGTSQAWISRVERDDVRPSLDSIERLLLVMGERPVLSSEPLPVEDDNLWRRAQREREMSERLERAWDASAFVEELRGTASEG